MVAIHLAFHFINWTCCTVPFGPFFTRSAPLAQGPYRQVLLPSPHALLERSSLMNYQSGGRFYVGMINGHLAHYLPNDTSFPPCIDWINLRVRHWIYQIKNGVEASNNHLPTNGRLPQSLSILVYVMEKDWQKIYGLYFHQGYFFYNKVEIFLLFKEMKIQNPVKKIIHFERWEFHWAIGKG